MCTFNRCSAKTSTVLLLFLIAGLCFSLMAGKNVTILSLFCHYSVSPLMLSQLNECVHLTDVAQRPLQFCYCFQVIDCAFHSWQAKMSLSCHCFVTIQFHHCCCLRYFDVLIQQM